jgi:hypothetical protein
MKNTKSVRACQIVDVGGEYDATRWLAYRYIRSVGYEEEENKLRQLPLFRHDH